MEVKRELQAAKPEMGGKTLRNVPSSSLQLRKVYLCFLTFKDFVVEPPAEPNGKMTRLRMKCSHCGHWNRVPVNIFIEQPVQSLRLRL